MENKNWTREESEQNKNKLIEELQQLPISEDNLDWVTKELNQLIDEEEARQIKQYKVMKRIPTLIVKWIANKLGYKIAMLKAVKGITTIEGDKELLKYVDVTGYFFKKEPLKRN